MAELCVTVEQGRLQGKVATTIGGKEYVTFLGVPYAEPPVGDLRFEAPVPVKKWSGVRDAKEEGSACCQLMLGVNIYAGDEDCLYLNIHTPKKPPKDGSLLPVMVYIHGGGFVNGSGCGDYFGPDFLVEQDVTLVTINYRLNVFGFLSLDIAEAPGNAGLKDQTLALKWIRDNIKSFKGDPNNVTLFGISAGSASVEYQMLSPMAKGLFQKVILQSGSTLNPWARSRKPVQLVHNLAKLLEIDYKDPKELLSKLKSVDAKRLTEVAFKSVDEELAKAGELFAFTPIVEKYFPGVEPFLCEEPMDILRSGRFTKVPTVSGFCENEGSHFRIYYDTSIEKMNQLDFINNLPTYADKSKYEKLIKDVYKCTSSKDASKVVGEFLSDSLFLAGIFNSLMERIRFNKEEYVYQFAYDGNINFLKAIFGVEEDGAFHGDDTSYLATTVVVNEEKATPKDKLVRSRMVKMWTNFAKTGNPTSNLDDLVNIKWPLFTQESKQILSITEDLTIESLPWPERRELWSKL